MITCKAKNCTSVLNEDKKLTFHKFPLFDQKLLKSWVNNIAPPDYEPGAEDHICSLHFTYDQFMKTQPWRLTRYAVPTILSRDTIPINLDDIPDTNNVPTGANKRNTAKRKAAVLEEEETSNSSSDDNSSDVSCSDVSSSSSDDDSESNVPKTRSKNKNKTEKAKTKKFSALAPRYMGDFREEDLQSPEKMKQIWDVAYKEITEQRNKLHSITQRNKRLEGQVTRLKNVIRHLKSVHK